MSVLPFQSKEEREIEALRAELDSLKLELQSLSENVTAMMEQLYSDLHQEVYNGRFQRIGNNPEHVRTFPHN